MPSNSTSKNATRTSANGETPEEIDEGATTSAQQQQEKSTVVQIDLLAPIAEEKRVCLAWENISTFVPEIMLPGKPIIEASKTVHSLLTLQKPNKQTTAPPKKQILFDVCGFVRPGEVAALMGPSGSGKTTLISILGGRAPKMMTVEGRFTFNGHEMRKDIRRTIGYVSQDDLLYENLTVYETLYYAALLRLPKFMSREEKLSRVEAVIQALGLDKCRNTVIGGGMNRGVSGGERKRVSVGHELLINPSVLILDEPTSGLDSTTAMHLVTTLKSLATGGRAILTTIHQPSSRLYQDLDTVMLLCEGHTLYYGASELTVEWFHQQGFDMPYGVNIAEYILDIANGNIEGQGMTGDESKTHLISVMSNFLKSNPRGFLKADDEERLRRVSQVLHDVTLHSQPAQQSQRDSLANVKKSDRWGATFPQQFCILLSRTIRNRRFSSLKSQVFFETIGITAVVIVLWWKSGEDTTLLGATDVSSEIFFVLIYVSFSQLFKAIGTFPSVFNLMVKERTSGMYRLSAFYLSETVCDLPMDFSITLILIISAYWAVHLRQSFSAFIGHVAIQLFSGLSIQTIGYLIGVTFRNPETAMSFATVLMVTLMLVTGFWVRDMHSWIEWIRYLAPPYWAYRVLLQLEFGDRQFLNCGGIGEEQLPREECTEVEDLGNALNIPVDVNGAKWPGIVATFAIIFFLRVLTYFALKAKTRFGI